MMKRVLIIAGEPSGDLHGSGLARELKGLGPIHIKAVGGIQLQAISDHFVADLASSPVSGIWEPLLALKRLKIVFQKIQGIMSEVDVVIPIDYYGFNVRVAEEAYKRGIPVFYFVSPQVWATRPGRIRKLRKFVSRMLVIFPFEKELYEKNGVPATFVGHPLLDQISLVKDRPDHVEPIVGLLPGSRPGEIQRHLPLMLSVAEKLVQERGPLRFILFANAHVSSHIYDHALSKRRSNFLIEVVRDENYQWRKNLDIALTSSGTATVENALLGIPMIAIYKASWVTYFLAKMLLNIRYVCMVNILLGQEIVPEYIQYRARVSMITGVMSQWLRNRQQLTSIRQRLMPIREVLSHGGAYKNAAKIIMNKNNTQKESFSMAPSYGGDR